MNSPDAPVSFIPYVQYAELIAQVGFFSSSFFCFVLIYLTLFGVKRSFGSYKYLLVIFPVCGIVFATLEIILYPNAYSHNAGYIFYSTRRPFNCSKDMVIWALAFYSGVYSSTISNIAVQFLYRYWAIFDETKLRFFKGWKFSFCMLYSVSFGVQWSVLSYHLDKLDDYSINYFDMELRQRYSIYFSDIAGMALVAYGADGEIRWRNVSCTINMTSIMLVQYALIIYCAVRMYLEMEAKVQMLSPSMRNLHKQFFQTLVLQIVVPTVSLFLPVTMLIYLPLFDLELDLPTGIPILTLTFYPAMDAIIVMYVVKDYRKAMKSFLKKGVDGFNAWINSPDSDGGTQTTPAPNPGAPVN